MTRHETPKSSTSRLRRSESILVRLLVPEIAILAPLGLSLACWLIPGESEALRGFEHRAMPRGQDWVVIAAWYIALTIVVHLARRIGQTFFAREVAQSQHQSDLAERRALLILTVLAVTGVAAALASVGSLDAVRSALSTSQGNLLNASIGGQAGFATLRYTTAIAAPYAIILSLRRIVKWPIAALNVLLLLVNTLFSSRLSLIMAVVVLLYLVSRHPDAVQLRTRSAVALGLGVGVSLIVLNYLRNANYYRSWGVTDPIMMNVYQVATYLGAPMQVSIGVAESISRTTFEPSAVSPPWSLLIPSFFQDKQAVNNSSLSTYPPTVDVAGNLTTNSVFADVASAYGYLGLATAAFAYAILAVLFGAVEAHRGPGALMAGVILYSFTEVWRVYLVNQGILVYLILVVLCVLIWARMSNSGHNGSSTQLLGSSQSKA